MTGRSTAAATSWGSSRDALIRLADAVLAEQHDKWAEGRRYLGLDVPARSRMTFLTDTAGDEVNASLTATAISA